MNYNELKQALQDYLESDETTFVSNIPIFVKTVENRIYNAVQLPTLRKNALSELTVGEKYLELPNDFLTTCSLALVDPDTGSYTYPLYKDVNLIREVYPVPTLTGTPKFYGLFNAQTLIFGPTPDKKYTAELHYFYYPETIVTAGTSWLGDNFPSVLLYGALSEGYRFQKGDQAQQQIYDAQYQEALSLLRNTAEGRSGVDAYSNVTPKAKPSVSE